MRRQQTYSTQSRGGALVDMSLQYDGNQLRKVTDQCGDLTYAGAMDFKDGANETVEYTWDANGNMTSDLNKGITSLAYNVLNLPERIMYDDNHLVLYAYAADGRKLQVKYLLNTLQTIVQPGINPGLHGGNGEAGLMSVLPPITPRPRPDSLEINPSKLIVTLSTVDYCAGHVYRNGVLERTMNDYGYQSDSTYYYFIKDYQGNVRAVIDQNGVLKEINNYYPYGGLMGAASAGVQPNKYGGKELDRENGIDWYDFEARFQDPMSPMFTTQDPLAEQTPGISPYAYCAGNPIRYIDPSGMEVNMSWFSMIDSAWGTNYHSQFLSDLDFITGLSLYEDENGMLDYDKDENGNPMIAKNDDGILQGSTTARSHLIAIINDKETITINAGHSSSSLNNEIGLNINQINDMIENSVNVDNRTLGLGMTFLHESFHTKIGGELKDDLQIYHTGDVVDNMNLIRKELNSNGYDFGQRMHYSAIPINDYFYIAFDTSSYRLIQEGVIPFSNRYIRIKNTKK